MNLDEPLVLQNSANLPRKLWIYTNYDCNLRCSYCVAKSSPTALRRAIGLETVRKLVQEAAGLGFEGVYFTGGEPFLLDEIYEMLAGSSALLPTIVLTNGMLLHGKRLEKLLAVRNDCLIVQVSLDGARPEHHDAYRGKGSWKKTVEGIRILLEQGFHVRLSTTETPVNSAYLAEICQFHQALGIPEEDHLVRALARRGFSQEGIEVGRGNVTPEITVNHEGIYWHPLSTDEDLLITREIFPLSRALHLIEQQAGLPEMAVGTVKPFQ